jgi:hypothetical protein
LNAGGPLRGGVTPGRARDFWLWTFVGILGLLLALYLAFPRLDADQAITGLIYWLAPRLTFEAPDIIVAQPFNDRYPPFTLAVDRSSRPAYVVQAGVETFRAWMEAIRVTAREETAGGYRIFHDFTPPPDTRPLARTPFTVSASPGRGDAASALDGDIDTGWSSGRGGTGPAWMEVDLGAERLVSGVTLVNDRAERVPDDFVVMVERAGTGWRQVAALAPQGVRARWENGAIRITPSRTLPYASSPWPFGASGSSKRERPPPGAWRSCSSWAPPLPDLRRTRSPCSSRRAGGSRMGDSWGRPSSAITRRCGVGPTTPRASTPSRG